MSEQCVTSSARACIQHWQQQLVQHVQQQRLLAVTAQGPKSYADLAYDVACLRAVLQGISATHIVLWSEESYPFVAGFLACLMAGKTLVLPPNNIEKTLNTLQADGAYVLNAATVLSQGLPEAISSATGNGLFEAVDWQEIARQPSIIFFSSGSTAAPKRIMRSLLQLLWEVETLQQVFQLPANAMMIATVSQQHIYGLLFKLLWPLQQGAAFYDQQLAYPEHVLHQAGQYASLHQPWLVSSPAFLKRWQVGVSAQPFQHIVSSGGVLPLQARALFDVPLTEVLGSTETGGMAYRSQQQPVWQAFPDVSIRIEDDALWVRSRHACSDEWMATGDSAQQVESAAPAGAHGFELGSRLDRIVKLEEKRLSLDAIEAALCEQSGIAEAHVLLVEPVAGRQQLGCVCVLTKNLQQQLQKIGKKAIVRQIKQQLAGQLESIAMPRQWRFVRQLPTNSQAKLNKQDIRALFMSQHLPLAKLVSQQEQQRIHLELEFLPEQLYFQGHFPDFPVYPGVAQIALVDSFAQQYCGVSGCCSSMEQIKFMRLIRPYDVLQLVLERNDNKVIFRLYGDLGNVATGRLIYDAASQNSSNAGVCAS